MKKLALWTVCLFVTSVATSEEVSIPRPFDGKGIVEYRVVGFTTTVTTGYVSTVDAHGAEMGGYRAMHHLCSTEVAPNARAATVAELLLTTDLVFPEGFEGAWILPSDTRIVYMPDSNDDTEDWMAYEAANGGFSGTFAPRVGHASSAVRSVDCSRYGDANPAKHGLFVRSPSTGDVGPILFTCSREVPIACSAPVFIPAG